jgi:hypothetical protein
VGLAAASVVLGVVAIGNASGGTDDPTNAAVASTLPPTTSDTLPPVTTTTTLPTTTTAPPTTTIATVEVPELVGMRLTTAKAALARRGLRATVRSGRRPAIPRGR